MAQIGSRANNRLSHLQQGSGPSLLIHFQQQPPVSISPKVKHLFITLVRLIVSKIKKLNLISCQSSAFIAQSAYYLKVFALSDLKLAMQNQCNKRCLRYQKAKKSTKSQIFYFTDFHLCRPRQHPVNKAWVQIPKQGFFANVKHRPHGDKLTHPNNLEVIGCFQ